jgi:hypothetical protein
MKRTHVVGVGPDAPIVTNGKGAKQSAIPYKFTDFDAKHVLRVAAVSARGFSKYGPRNYLGISAQDHLDHALTHINAFLAGDPQEDHLAHAICRLYFAMATTEPLPDPAPVVEKNAAESCYYQTINCVPKCPSASTARVPELV